ncbi:microsomal signal peptidase 25 kDa subunit-domain-containing protein [Phyllosticta citricarpa]|uniref:Signal peptidase complex subunit 2 n=1 Tax=Phyllosticta citricarpa TaxID=55181 RepID=A0ABR1L760_9PEZI
MSNAEQKIQVHSVPDLRNTSDDALPNYLNSLKFTQDNKYLDVRLALGYTAVTVAGLLFYFDWKLGWDATKAWTGPAVAAYFVLNGAFMYWMYIVEKGLVYAGEKDGQKIRISSRVEKHIPIYHLTIRYTTSRKPASARGELWQQIELSAPFTRWFTADGFFVTKPFQQFLASEIPIVGEADPTNVVEEIGRGSASETKTTNPANVAQVLGQIRAQTASSSGASAAGGKARKRG